MQLLVLLYIEGGTLLELEDEDWSNQRWEILFLYGPSQTFIGYATLYRYLFFSLERSDLSRLRLSQFLILPPFQRQGHGSRFYDAIMTHYLPQDTITELTVEDPSESFSDLRDRRDLLRLSHHPAFASLTLASATPEALTTIRKEAKMPLRQFLRCVEMKLLRDLETPNKAFRILVKRRIYKQHADVLAQLDRLERIDKLDETYHHVEDDYRRLLKGMENERVEEEEEENAKRGSVGGEEGRPKKRVRVLEE